LEWYTASKAARAVKCRVGSNPTTSVWKRGERSASGLENRRVERRCRFESCLFRLTGYVMVTNQAPTLHERVRFLHPVSRFSLFTCADTSSIAARGSRKILGGNQIRTNCLRSVKNRTWMISEGLGSSLESYRVSNGLVGSNPMSSVWVFRYSPRCKPTSG
jgi:hypothetical protein